MLEPISSAPPLENHILDERRLHYTPDATHKVTPTKVSLSLVAKYATCNDCSYLIASLTNQYPKC